MSSTYIRSQFKTFLSTDLATENVIDMTGQYHKLNKVIGDVGLTRQDPWLGLQFIGSNEEYVSVSLGPNKGCYREHGSVFFHVVDRVSNTVVDDILLRTEVLRDLFRGRRINDIVVESVTPPNFESGATLQLDAGYQSASIIVNFYRDLNL